MKTILLTGASGFLGSYLAAALLDNGYHLIAYRRKNSSSKRLKNYERQIEWYDLDKEGMTMPFLNHKIDTVIHTATSYGRNGSIGEILEANLLFPAKLFELCTKNSVKLFVNTDSFYNIGHLIPGEYVNEFPSNYSLSKKQFLDWILNWRSDVKVVNMKLQHLYGPLDNYDKFIPYIISNCLKNTPQLKLTSGEQRRNFIYIKDVVNAFLKILEFEVNDLFQEYQIGGSEIITIRKAVEKIKYISGSRTELLFGSLPNRNNEFINVSVDTSKMQSIGWNQEYTFNKGIKETIEAIKDQLDKKLY